MVADHQGVGDQGRMMMADGSFGSRAGVEALTLDSRLPSETGRPRHEPGTTGKALQQGPR